MSTTLDAPNREPGAELAASTPPPDAGGTQTDDGDRGSWWVELVAGVLLGIAAILTAYAAYNGALAGGDALKGYTESQRLTADANLFYDNYSQTYNADQALFLQYQVLVEQGDQATAEVIKDNLFSEALIVATDAWLALPEGEGPATPLDTDEYVIESLDTAEQLTADADLAFQAGAADRRPGRQLRPRRGLPRHLAVLRRHRRAVQGAQDPGRDARHGGVAARAGRPGDRRGQGLVLTDPAGWRGRAARPAGSAEDARERLGDRPAGQAERLGAARVEHHPPGALQTRLGDRRGRHARGVGAEPRGERPRQIGTAERLRSGDVDRPADLAPLRDRGDGARRRRTRAPGSAPRR